MTALAGIVLAAGRSTRFGSNKLLAELGGKPLVRHVVEKAIAAGLSPVIVIVGHDATRVRDALSGLDVVFGYNCRFAEGMSTSLQLGASLVPHPCDGAVVFLGDMPLVRIQTIQALMYQFATRSNAVEAVVPLHNAKRGNPVALSAQMLSRLDTLLGDSGAKTLLRSPEVAEIDVQDPGILLDADTPDALESLRT